MGTAKKGYVLNPTTNRWVKADGVLAKKLGLAKTTKKSPTKKSPTKKSPTKKTTKKIVKPPRIIFSPEKSTGDCIERSNLPLKEHQKNVVNFLRHNRGVIAAYPTGSGKTLAAVTASQCILDIGKEWKVIVVTPVSLQDNFKKELKQYGANPDDKRYEFYTIDKFSRELEKDKIKYNDKTFLIIDEAHNLRTEITPKSGKKARKFIKCAKKVGKILLLTATPLYNEPYDIANLVAMVKGINAPTPAEFGGILGDKKYRKEFLDCTFAFFEDAEKKDYPIVNEHNVKIEMSHAYYKEYHKAENVLPGENISKNPWAFLNGMRQATNNLSDDGKIKWVMKHLKEWGTKGEKTLIYSEFITAGLNAIKNKLNSKVYVEVTGKLSKAKRDEAVKKFNENPNIKILFISQAGGEGLDLKRVMNVIIMERTWNRASEEQVIGRAARYRSHIDLPKEKQIVNVYKLILTKPENINDNIPLSADEMVANISEGKQELINMFLKELKKYSIDECMKNGRVPQKLSVEIEGYTTKEELGKKSSKPKTIVGPPKKGGRGVGPIESQGGGRKSTSITIINFDLYPMVKNPDVSIFKSAKFIHSAIKFLTTQYKNGVVADDIMYWKNNQLTLRNYPKMHDKMFTIFLLDIDCDLEKYYNLIIENSLTIDQRSYKKEIAQLFTERFYPNKKIFDCKGDIKLNKSLTKMYKWKKFVSKVRNVKYDIFKNFKRYVEDENSFIHSNIWLLFYLMNRLKYPFIKTTNLQKALIKRLDKFGYDELVKYLNNFAIWLRNMIK